MSPTSQSTIRQSSSPSPCVLEAVGKQCGKTHQRQRLTQSRAGPAAAYPLALRRAILTRIERHVRLEGMIGRLLAEAPLDAGYVMNF